MEIIAISLPIFLLLGLGWLLARTGLFTPAFTEGANRFVYRISLPALIVSSLTKGALNLRAAGTPALAVGSAALLVLVIALAAARLFGCRGGRGATFVQAAFRGNLAFVGLPVLASATGGNDPAFLATAVLVFAPVMLVYNIAAVLLFHFAQHRGGSYLKALSGLASNPLILATILGGIMAALLPPLPGFLAQTLELLGAPAAPLALLCIGAALAGASLTADLKTTAAMALLKVALCPLVTWALGAMLGLQGAGLQIAMVFAACPTAAASYVFARELGGDGRLASNAVVLSTLLSPISLTVVLALFFQ